MDGCDWSHRFVARDHAVAEEHDSHLNNQSGYAQYNICDVHSVSHGCSTHVKQLCLSDVGVVANVTEGYRQVPRGLQASTTRATGKYHWGI